MNTEELRVVFIEQRKALGLTQASVAQRAQVSREMISHFENGTHDIGLRKLERICSAVDLEILFRAGKGRPVLEDLDALFNDDE
jgi:transcriptional regulator with XRE-family HTH domain